ncbi:Rho GTPase-activating protein, putative [Entamoeba invadens IP1]|uniref:Rho GTPase-activating protein, putative n=1 Tax=Entamoeba invadens IP1 TaxID=370355 RepID=A0A0A1U6L6_ENTIV|nr:Rho GTPase-activating protein, putative [Entamoeba invadens IP1]ELP87456.1 Rho GTPase-activating protein, putative [Entamoeba invadens IP1]|eukprot:XP_004254227.1 Rho GTPase-activating protein, putative [Entamoeba invadens IP1]
MFGVSVDKLNQTYVVDDIPMFVTDAGTYVMAHIVEGIFRIPGERKLADAMVKMIEKRADFLTLVKNPNTDVHAVATILLMFIRELPEPLITFNMYSMFIDTARTFEADHETKASAIRVAIQSFHAHVSSLPPRNKKLLAFYMNMFYEFCTMSNIHKMEPNNVAVCIAPTLLRPEEETWESAMSTIKLQTLVCTFLIKYYPLIFRDTCENNGLLYPQLQTFSMKQTEEALKNLTKSMKKPETQVRRRVRKTIWEDVTNVLKEDEKVNKQRRFKLKQNGFMSQTLCLGTTEVEEEKEEVRKRPKSDSFAMTLKFIDDNQTQLPQINDEILKMHTKKTKSRDSVKKKIPTSFSIPKKKTETED